MSEQEKAQQDHRRRFEKRERLLKTTTQLFTVEEVGRLLQPPGGWSNHLASHSYNDKDEQFFDGLLVRLAEWAQA